MGDATARERALEVLADVAGASALPDPSCRLDEIGIDSLGLAEVAAALRAELGVDVDGEDVGPETPVADLIERIGDGLVPTGALPRGNGRVQRLAVVGGGPGLRWWFDLRVRGRGNVPLDGPVVLAMNHESALDIPLVAVATPRPVTFMAKRELFKNGFLSWWLNALGAFRVDRDRFDLRAVDVALGVLDRGEVLGMYPEGTRSAGRLLPFLDGAAWLALRTGARLVPAALIGTERATDARRPRGAPVRIEFLPALPAERVEDPAARRRRAREITEEVRSRIAAALRTPPAPATAPTERSAGLP